MSQKKPTSFIVFIAVTLITTSVFLSGMLFAHYQVDKKYSMLLAFFMFVTFAFTTVGIYSGFKFKTDNARHKRLNLIGLIGNFTIFLSVLGMMAYAAIMPPINPQSTTAKIDHLICKKWKPVAYEEGGKRFDAPEKFQFTRMNFFPDHTIESSGKGTPSIGDWQYNDSLKMITIVDKVSGETILIGVKSIDENELVVEIGKPEERTLTLYMKPDTGN